MNGRVDREGDVERLEECLGRLAAGDDPSAALAACPPAGAAETADTVAVDPLPDLLALASRLRREGAAVEGPTAAFKAELASRLAAAPAPSSARVSAAEPIATSASASEPISNAITDAEPISTSASPPSTPTSELVRVLDAWLSARGDEAPGVPDRSAQDGSGAPKDLAPLLELATTLSRDGARADGPSAAFRADLARRLAEAPQPRSVRAPRRAPAGVLQRLWRSTAFMAATAATVILFLGAGVTYASADALPGQWLYPIKRSVEGVRLAVASEGGAMDLRLDFAERRLAEAIGVPGEAGSALADFSHQVSSALAIVDASIAAGAPRERVAEPLVDWLVAARRDLIVAQNGLPPMAWRGARALLDEAIVALSGGGVITGRAVWRLSEPAAVLALHDVPTHPWAWRIARAGRPIALDAAQAPAPVLPPIALLVTARDEIAAPVERRPGSGQDQTPVAAAPATGPGDAGAAPRDPGPERPSTPAPRPTAIPTATPAPPDPTAPPTEPEPTVSPPTEPAPTEPPASPTSAPIPTATPRIGLPLPARLDVYCDPETVESAGSTMCRVVLPEPAMPGEVQWSASFGRIDVPDPDSPEIAVFTDDTGMSGVAKLIVTITVSFTPSDGPSSTGTTEVFIVPRLGGEDG